MDSPATSPRSDTSARSRTRSATTVVCVSVGEVEESPTLLPVTRASMGEGTRSLLGRDKQSPRSGGCRQERTEGYRTGYVLCTFGAARLRSSRAGEPFSPVGYPRILQHIPFQLSKPFQDFWGRLIRLSPHGSA